MHRDSERRRGIYSAGGKMSRPSSSSGTLPPFLSNRNDASSASLISRGSSGYGRNRYVHLEDNGVYISPLGLTLLVSAITTLGILLVTLVITLSVMLSSCQDEPLAFRAALKSSSFCDGFIVNAEVNNLQGWVVSEKCVPQVEKFMTEGQYDADIALTMDAAAQYLNSLPLSGDGSDVVVMDIDETVLSNLPYYIKHKFGAEIFNEAVWNDWVEEAAGLPLFASLALFNQLKDMKIGVILLTGRPESQRNVTSLNLISAGYEGWVDLLLRDPSEIGMTAVDYKSGRRVQLEQDGYRILSSLGDQWSDLHGPAAGNRTFKLANPMYYIF